MSNQPYNIVGEWDRSRSMIHAAAQAEAVSAVDVARFRQLIPGGRPASREDADALFALEAAPVRKCPEWTNFFIETLTEHVVWQARPTGVVNEAQGEWLIGWADRAASLNTLALLVNVLAEAHRAPAWFLAAVRKRAQDGWCGVDVPRLLQQAEIAAAA